MGKLNIPRHIPTPDEAFNDMLGVKKEPSKNDIVDIEIDKLIPYKTKDDKLQQFNLYSQEELEQLAEGIKTLGVLSPVIVRPHPSQLGCYEIIAGHNRTNASELAGLTTVPCIIKNVDDIEAELIMLDTNLDQRKELSFRELSNAYKMKLDIENQQGNRTDLTPRQVVAKFTPAEKRKAQRYARLTYLISSLMIFVEEKQLSFMAGVELSYISESSQELLHDYATENKTKISLRQAEELRKLEKDRDLTSVILQEFFNPTKPTKEKTEKKKTSISIRFADIEGFVDIEQEDLEGYIFRALQAYKNNSDGE